MAEHLLTPSIRYRILSYTLSGLLVLQPVLPALAASITPVTPGTQMDKAGNGVPVVNIATPNQAGISHNQYQDFNVGKEGVILNNATDRLTQTQLGGLIQNNPNLKPGKEASGIINEVVGANRSELQGFVEVAGKQANVMVANPYGITCSGCGFINTPQATLTTGKPVLDASGVLQSVEVTKGSISIEGQGLNASQTDRVSLIARATEMNAQLHAKDLTVIAGANRVKADGTVVPIKGEGQVPTLAIDTRALGGMYANRIKLVSSETGVGVNLGNLNARQGDIQLDSHGHLTLGNTLAQGNLQVNAAQATLSGEQKAGNTIDVNAQDGLVMNDATLTSGKTISLSSRGTVNINDSRVAAGTDAQGAVTPQGSLALSAQRQNWKNSALSAGNVTVKATQSLTQDTPSTLMGLKSVNVDAAQATLDGKISSAQDISLTGQTLTTGKQSELNAQRNLEIKSTQAAMLQGQALAGQDVQLASAALTQSGTLKSNRNTTLNTQSLDNAGLLQSSGSLTLNGEQLNNRGRILSGAGMNVSALNLSNAGLLSAQQQLSLELQHALDVASSGQLLSDTAVFIHADDLQNAGLIRGTQSLDINSHNVSTRANSSLLSDGDVTLSGQTLSLAGLTSAKGALSLNGQSLTTQQSAKTQSAKRIAINATTQGDLSGELFSNGSLDIKADHLIHRGNTQAQSASINTTAFENQGQLTALGDLTLQSQSVNQSGTIQASGLAVITANSLGNHGVFGANSLTFNIGERLTNAPAGLMRAENALNLHARNVDNAGKLTAQALSLTVDNIDNNGLLRGLQALNIDTQSLSNRQDGVLYSQRGFTLSTPVLTNSGLIGSEGDITLSGQAFDNSGETHAANLTLAHKNITNASGGRLLADNVLTSNSDVLTNAGLLAADIAKVTTTALTNTGTLQGSTSLTAQTQSVDNTGRLLTQGQLQLEAQTLNNAGAIQAGQALTIHALDFINALNGTLLSTGTLNLDTETFTNQGELLSQDEGSINADHYDNQGSLLSAAGLTLGGHTLANTGNIQGQRLTVNTGDITNNGTLIGLDALTFTAHDLTLNNAATGKLLSQGMLTVNGKGINNDGVWQAQDIVLNTESLNHQGVIQSANTLLLTLSNMLKTSAGSQITANGQAALQALSIINQGEWIAKNLTIKAGHLDNAGTISGVDGLTIEATQDVITRIDSQLLSAGALVLNAASIDNQGRLQGNNVDIHAQTLRNTGQIYSASEMVIVPNKSLTNLSSGVIQSKQGLTLTAPSLSNEGLIQGGESSQINATDSLHNSGKLLFAKDLTLSGGDLVNTGLIQADAITQNVMTLDNQGTWRAQQQGSLTGDTLKNTGTLQAGNLTLTAHDVNNGGTVLGTSSVNVQADSLSIGHDAALMSGGDLRVVSTALDALGRIVALGDTTLNIINTFTGQNVVAAGKTLTVHTQGDLRNQNVMQGQAVNLHAGGTLNNQGQITLGTGESTFDAQRITLDASGSVQGGGNIALTSASDILVNGFTGTAGSLTLSAINNILNTALLYAGHDMRLYAQSVKNQRADILAGNSLWIQKDAAGNANSEIVNTSGTIETQSGDITLNTAHLLNQRDGLKATQSQVNGAQTLPGVGDTTLAVDISQLPEGSFGVNGYSYTKQSGPCNGHGACSYNHFYQYYYAPFKDTAKQRFVYNQIRTDVTSDGGAARIASGRNLTLHAGALDNAASVILANKNMTLAGNTLNNQSWQSGTWTDYLVYEYAPEKYSQQQYATGTVDTLPPRYNPGYTSSGESIVLPKTESITFTLAGHENAEEVGDIYRSVIQAGGDVTAQFADTIGNETTSSHAGQVGGTLSAPQLNALSQPQVNTGVDKEGLTDTDSVTVGGPRWHDQLQDALQSVTGGQVNVDKTQPRAGDTSAYPLPTGNNGYFVTTTDPDSPYLITTNPKLNGLGQLDNSVFNDLNALLGMQPGQAPRETNSTWTDEHQYYGSSYFMDRLNLHPDYDYRFLGDAAFDTRYVSNALVNQTGSRYLNGMGSDLAQMQYLIDNAAKAQQGLGLSFGVALNADQIAALDNSILWWEASTINGQTVMVPKLYLSPKDTTVRNGSVIAGNNITANAGTISNNGSTLTAQNNASINSQNTLDNLNAGLLNAGGSLNLSALGDINNVGSTISGKTLKLDSVSGSINNLTQAKEWQISGRGEGHQTLSFTDTQEGPTANITAQDTLSMQAGKDINVTGAKVSAGGDLSMAAQGNITAAGNMLTDSFQQSGAWNKTDSSDKKTTYHGSAITSGGNLQLQAGQDIAITGSALNAGQSASVQAGHDINLNAAQTQTSQQQGSSETHRSGLDRTTLSAGDNLTLKAGQDIDARAAGLAAEKSVTLQAGRDVNLLAEATASGDSYHAKKNTTLNESVRQQGTDIASGGNTVIAAGRDITAQAASVTTTGDIGLTSGRDINLTTAQESDYHYQEKTKTKSGFLSKKTTHTIEEDSATHGKSTVISGNNVTVQAGNNMLIQGSAVAGDGNVTLGANKNVDILAATNTDTSWRFKETKKSGFMGTGGIGFTIGSSKTTHDLREQGTTQSQSVSTVGSTGGNVSITAGQQAHIGGADIIAQKDITLRGDSVVVEPGHDKRTRDETFESKSSGLTVALSGTVGSAVNNAVQATQEAKEESDGRLGALKATKAALSGVQAGQSVAVAQGNGDPNNGLGVSLSLTTQKSKSEQHSQSDRVSGSTLNAGNNLTIAATGKGHGANSGDILIGGSQLKAGGDTTLAATNDIVLSGAASTEQTTGKNSSSGGGVGVSIGGGTNGYGIGVFANVNAAKGHDKGNGTDWTESTLDSGGTVTLNSGRDALLNGAQVSGDKVVADIGRDLWMSSQQDSNDYTSKQNSVAAGGSFTFGSMSGSGYLSASQDKMKSNYDSVQEQTGIYAGIGGFDITVGQHTQLDGAVIASQADKSKNSLETGTLGFNDIHNKADFKVSHTGISLSGGGDFGGDTFKGNMPGGMISAGGNSGHAEGTTQSAVAGGAIVIRDPGQQKQSTDDLSRDTEHANDSISPIFDKEKEQKRLQSIGLIGDIGGQAMDIARTQGEINALDKARETYPGKTVEQLKETQLYRDELAKYGTGSDIQRGIQAATAALQGLAGGNVAGALAGASAPELANIIGHHAGIDNNEAAKTIAHAILGGAVAAIQGNSATAGVGGALTGELAAKAIMSTLYPGKTVSELSESEKQTLSTLASISSGIAGGLVGGNTSSAATGAQAGKNAVENNYLSQKQQAQKDKEIAECQTVACKVGARAKWTAIDLGQDGSFAAGMVAGVPASLYDTIDSIVKTASSPSETYEALKSLFNSGDVLGNVSDAVKQSYIDRIDSMEAEYQKAGASGSFNAGVEGGKLVTDIASLLAGGAGVVKGGAVLTEKVVAKVAGKAESAVINAGKATTINFPNKVIGEYSAVKPGPLSNDLAGTFSGGKYKEVILQQDTVLYRAGMSDKPFGQFFSSESPQGVLQTRIDKAVLPQWPGGGSSPIDSSIAIRIPAGTKVYVGEVGSQNGFYVGGTQQIVVPKPWTIKGAEVIEVKPLK
ncbi:hemagglutinin repeat-containing protein [Hafnia alvei]|uniref:hemagglutinin repeat-containing protein n=1 Tax=Hafnia alvei TaxID=569 RepID=UPI0024A87A8E|nr:hemagglutinin repeat-containing protein [Hafnia alvei]